MAACKVSLTPSFLIVPGLVQHLELWTIRYTFENNPQIPQKDWLGHQWGIGSRAFQQSVYQTTRTDSEGVQFDMNTFWEDVANLNSADILVHLWLWPLIGWRAPCYRMSWGWGHKVNGDGLPVRFCLQTYLIPESRDRHIKLNGIQHRRNACLVPSANWRKHKSLWVYKMIPMRHQGVFWTSLHLTELASIVGYV